MGWNKYGNDVAGHRARAYDTNCANRTPTLASRFPESVVLVSNHLSHVAGRDLRFLRQHNICFPRRSIAASLRHGSTCRARFGAYPVGDGGRMMIAIRNEREWARFCAHILRDAALATDPRFAGHPARLANRPAMDALIVATFGRHDMNSLADALGGAKIAFGRLNDVAGLAAHPQLRRARVATPAGTVEIVAPPVRHGESGLALRPVPALGAHSDAIRAEFAGEVDDPSSEH